MKFEPTLWNKGTKLEATSGRILQALYIAEHVETDRFLQLFVSLQQIGKARNELCFCRDHLLHRNTVNSAITMRLDDAYFKLLGYQMQLKRKQNQFTWKKFFSIFTGGNKKVDKKQTRQKSISKKKTAQQYLHEKLLTEQDDDVNQKRRLLKSQ